MWRFALLFALAACSADLPPVDGTISAAAQAAPPPVLVPIDALLAGASPSGRAAAAQPGIAARGATLRRAAIADPPAADLAARGRRLRARAADLRARPI